MKKIAVPAFLARVAGLLVGLAILTAGAQAQPSGIRIAPDLIVETVSEIDTGQLWHLSPPEHQPSKQGKPPGGIIGVWTYSDESGLYKDGWIAICLIMDGFGDIAETPVAIRVWAKSRAKPRITERAHGGDHALSFEIKVGADSFILAHTPLGVVFVNDQKVGEIR